MQREMVHGHGDGNHHQHQQLPRYSAAAAATGVARASKKSKPKKIPQRGLGVAQLEKLRIEEQKMEGSMPVSGPTHLGVGVGGFGHLLPMHPPPHAPLPLLPRPGADGGVHCGYPSVLWDPASASAVADPMKHPFYKRSLCPLPPLPTWHGQVSVGLSLTAASSSHPTEPPSNQMYSSGGGGAETAAAEDDEDRVHAVVESVGGGRRGQTLALGVRGLEHDRLPDDGGGEGPSRSRRQDNERGRRRRRWLARRLCRRRPEQIRVQQSHHELLQLEREFSRLVIAGVGALQEQQGEGACPCLPHLERAACATREAASSCAPLDQTPGVGSLGRHAASSARERFGVVVRVGVAAVLQLHAGWSGSHRQTPDRDQGRRRL
ncbi:uncharacterized protein [Zea mays]|uniref:uncharacterized protein isoform X8 n=1 Tax=Zea mays TaxID=4577 RepID=UPI0004DEC34D|nr:uncharacterized protein LOC100278132 isoform X8 [Zea mays]|eukprot:XP_023157724.1 uncharacterized protein LOC100278132 isoform X7 [Zea mays]